VWVTYDGMKTIALGLAIVCLAACGRTPSAALSRQIAGDDCDYEVRVTPEGERCHPREWSLMDYGDPARPPRCQIDAARCASLQREHALVPDLIRGLSEEVDEFDTGDGIIPVRAAFAEALGELGDRSAIDPLIEVLQHSSLGARAASADALGCFEFDAWAAVPHLERAKRTPNPSGDSDVEVLRSAASRALGRIRP